jgi:hypothetical protein
VTDDPDIKDLLGRAFDQEPPLRIDRDEVFRVGRTRLRRRRVFEAGGAVAAVVVAVVGASLLTGMVGEDTDDDRIPPAASSTQVAPPGPGLPLPETESPASTTNRGSPSSPVSLSPAFTSAHAAELTQALYHSATMNNMVTVPPKPEFVVRGNSYMFDTDVTSPGVEGALRVTVEAQLENDVRVNCGDMPKPGDCAVNFDHQTGVAVSHWTGDKVSRIIVRAVLSDGSRITALSTNHSARQVNAGESPSNLEPPINEDDLVNLVLKSGLHVT